MIESFQSIYRKRAFESIKDKKEPTLQQHWKRTRQAEGSTGAMSLRNVWGGEGGTGRALTPVGQSIPLSQVSLALSYRSPPVQTHAHGLCCLLIIFLISFHVVLFHYYHSKCLRISEFQLYPPVLSKDFARAMSKLIKLSFYYLHNLALTPNVPIHLCITMDMPCLTSLVCLS